MKAARSAAGKIPEANFLIPMIRRFVMAVNLLSPSNKAEEIYDAIAYYRLSKDDGSGHTSDSIENQKKLIRAYLNNHPNIHLVEEADDDGYTGTNYDRPGFRKVLEAIESGRVNCVIVKDLSRLGREYIETGKYLEMIFPSMGVRFIAINDDVDSDKSGVGDEIIIPIKNIMNESYCRDLSTKLRKQFRIQRGNGEYLGAFVSYGYCKSPDDKHKLVIDEYAAEVVRGIFSLFFKGYSQNMIADFLNEEHTLTPAEYKQSQGLKYKTNFQIAAKAKWSVVQINRILTNPIYIGTLVQGKRGTPNYKIKTMRIRKPTDWVTVENNHPAIIDPLTFSIVQRMLLRDTRKSPDQEVLLPLAGVLFCADCGKAMQRRCVTRAKKRFYYYVCSTSKNGKGCSSHSFEQTQLEETILHALLHQIKMATEMEQLLQEIGSTDMQSTRVKRLDMLIAQKNKDIDGYQDFRMRLYEALNDDLIDRDEYSRMRLKYTQMIEEGQEAVRKLQEQRAEAASGSCENDGWIQQYLRFQDLKVLSREAVVALIDRIYVYEDKRIKIDFNYRNEIAYYQEIIQQKAKEVC
ncbi:MAG: recombinase family protein [Faecousia sp.]